LNVAIRNPATRLVAVVDDDESVRGALKDALESVGLAALPFVSAEEFLSSGRLDEICCLVTDLKMPGMSGLELQAKLLEEKRSIPTIFITGHWEPRTRALAMGAGAVAFLSKPFDDNRLLEVVRGILKPDTNR
jgi:FixJ family two-component response regulator